MFMDLRIVYHNPSLSLWVQPEGVWAFPLRQIDNQMEKQWAGGGRFGKLMQSALALILGISRRAMQPQHPSATAKLDFASHRLANKSCALRGRRACECSSLQLTCFRCFRSTLTSDCGAGKCERSTLHNMYYPFLQICAIEKVCAASKAFLCC